MLDKFYKSAVILIAVLLLGFSVFLVLSPSKAISKPATTESVTYSVPESHVWDAISNQSVDGYDQGFLLYNKVNGEYKIIKWERNMPEGTKYKIIKWSDN